MPDEMDEIISEFVAEAEESLDRIDPLFVELESKGQDKNILNDIFRSMHTIKGAAGFLGFQSIVDVSHKAESIMKKLRDDEMIISTSLIDVILKSVDMIKLLLHHIKTKDGKEEDTSNLLKELDNALNTSGSAGKEAFSSQKNTSDNAQSLAAEEKETPPQHHQNNEQAEQPIAASEKPASPDKPDLLPAKETIQTLRIDVNRVDKVMDLTGEIVLVRNRLLNIANYLDEKYSGDHNVENLIGTVSFLDLVTADMQLAVTKMRMQPLKKVFGKFPRLVRDLSNNIGKDVELVISGEETEVDRSVIEHIGDPLVHIIRNSIDHGLETKDERLLKGKPAKGKVIINAYQQGNQIFIEISDDGKGIALEKIKQKAVERSLITEEEAQRMTDESAINLIFLPGFSTVAVATELSGRGVGMDVVKTNISRLNGYVEVTTKKDIGTTFKLSIPLTLAIVQALMVRAGISQYAIPLAPIEETLRIKEEDIENVTGQKVLVVREKIYPLFDLTEIVGCSSAGRGEYLYALIIAIGDKRFCITVDELLGQEEIVIKSIDGIDTESSYIVGATITGDGKVVLILDLAGIQRNVLGTVRI